MSILDKNDPIWANFRPSHIEYNLFKEHYKNSFHIKNQEDLQRRLEDIGQKGPKMSMLAKNDQILAKNSQILAISEFSRHIEYDFLKEHLKTCFYIKNYENLKQRLKIQAKKAKKMAKFWPKNDQILAKNGQK